MPVVAMKCIDKQSHEKTDKLFIYRFDSPEQEERTIVANLTNVYEVGDVVAVALPGTRLPGVVIEPRKVFGIPSSGMALGPVDAALDTDLTEQFDADREPRPFTVTLTVTVDAPYAEDAEKVARKAIGKGQGEATATPA
jgi:phenylalanyl-tRNA synthetase beta chain